MGTHSAIGILNVKSVESIYCHYDGYINGVGKTLNEHYDLEKTKKLIELGDLSSLGSVIGEKHDFNNCLEDTCNFYGRDRGESSDSVVHVSIKSFLDHASKRGCEYFYLFNTDKWYRVYLNGTQKLLTDCL